MSKIAFLKVANFLGITEMELEAAKINIFKGPKGKGKSSVLEAIEKSITNKSRRTEVIKHNEEEASMFLELDDGLEIDRRIRREKGKSDYLKIRKADEGVPSTEKFLRDLISGEIFRPIDWVNKSVKEQTKSLLSMLEIGWSEQDIVNWFGDLVDDIDYSQHILLILKNIELKYYKRREEVNREVKELKARIDALYQELPAEYDGEQWRNKNIQEYYKKVSKAQEINNLISTAKSIQDNFTVKVNSIKANAESEKSKIRFKYNSYRDDIKDIIDLSKSKIEKAKGLISNSEQQTENKVAAIKNEINTLKLQEEKRHNDLLVKLEEEYRTKLQEAEVVYNKNLKEYENNIISECDNIKKFIESEVDNQRDLIGINENKIAAKQQELVSLDEKEEVELNQVDLNVQSEIEKEEIRIGKASKYLEDFKEIDITPLQEEADTVTTMVGYLRDWDRIAEIRDGSLASKISLADDLTSKIEMARSLPGELLKTAKMPIDGISVDVEGRVRINGTLIDGLSDGERLELAMKVAKAQCGTLKVICLDRFESLDLKSQALLLEEMKNDEYQYFITQVSETESNELEIEKIG